MPGVKLSGETTLVTTAAGETEVASAGSYVYGQRNIKRFYT